ncbi:MAG TPA: TAXI family TRAP transporter solute-binding subunit [Chloroflexota bacterium]|nr:TAXI family TRAP transporter solute-binding subunit [Chloroflexota bacterium]
MAKSKGGHVMPVETRSKLVLEVAAELVAHEDKPWRQAMVFIRDQGAENPWSARLFGTDTPGGIDQVANGECDLAIINPSGPLTLAYRGTGPYKQPVPVRVITCIPSYDQFAFNVHPDTGLNDFEEIGEKRVPLRISVRGQQDHSVHFMLRHIMQAAGFSWEDLEGWGGKFVFQPGMPNNPGRVASYQKREVNAIFDEAVGLAMQAAEANGMKTLPLRESTVKKLEAMGYRRGIIEAKDYPWLKSDILSIDFSGWPVYCHENTPDDLVTAICEGLEERKDRIPWQGEGPLPLERMCFDTPEGPLDVPLHPAAERFWRARGYLR